MKIIISVSKVSRKIIDLGGPKLNLFYHNDVQEALEAFLEDDDLGSYLEVKVSSESSSSTPEKRWITLEVVTGVSSKAFLKAAKKFQALFGTD